MDKKHLKIQASLVFSALIGGVLCILADLMQKSEASAVLLIGNKLGTVVEIPAPIIATIILILIVASSLPIIFESATKKAAFYAGASVLAILMTITPYDVPPGLKTQPNSVEVILSVTEQGGGLVKGAIVTVKSGDKDGGTIVARSRMPEHQVRFYLDGGSYSLIVELPGYQAETRGLTIMEGASPKSINIMLHKSATPLFIQRLLR